MTTKRIRVALSKKEIEYLLEQIPEMKIYSGNDEQTKERIFINNWIRAKLQQAGIKLMFGRVE